MVVHPQDAIYWASLAMSETALYLLTRTYLEGPLVQEKNAKYAIMCIFCCHLSRRRGHICF